MNEDKMKVEIPGGTSATLYLDAPQWGDHKTACFGSLCLKNLASGRDLFQDFEQRLASNGYTALIGPMDGDTWHSYRVVTKSDGSPAFLMEPQSGEHDLKTLERAGFRAIEHYISSKALLANACARKPARMTGIKISHWDGRDGEQLIGQLFDMSGQAFADNHFYKPLEKSDFLALYAPVMSMVDPQYILFAHNSAGNLIGFLFAVPNMLEGPKPQNIIIKTYASARPGVGHLLADHLHRYALNKGFSSVIHALMHENNTSRRQSAKYSAVVMRRYALMGKILGD